MKKTIYYQAQFSKDGETWTAFSAHRKYDVVTDYDEIKAIYDGMLNFHSLEWNAAYKHHRIAKYEVLETIINVEA